MSDIKNVLGKEEFNDIINSEVPVIVDFYATWCGPCKMQAPILHEFKDEIGDKAIVVKVDVDENAQLAALYGVQSIPTLAVLRPFTQLLTALRFQVHTTTTQVLARLLALSRLILHA